jgi:hypothetical protein
MHRLNRDEACKRALRESILSNDHDIISLENTTHSTESNVSRYTLREGEDKKNEIRPNNSFLHDNVD